MQGSNWRLFQNILFIIQMCLEKCRKFWKNQGKVREFHWEQNVETMIRVRLLQTPDHIDHISYPNHLQQCQKVRLQRATTYDSFWAWPDVLIHNHSCIFRAQCCWVNLEVLQYSMSKYQRFAVQRTKRDRRLREPDSFTISDPEKCLSRNGTNIMKVGEMWRQSERIGNAVSVISRGDHLIKCT